MTPRRRQNLLRLLKPRHVALIGGRDAEIVAGECARIGFAGPVWPVNPKRATMGAHRCYPRIEDLPEAPDAVFLGVPREAAIDALDRLRRMGAGGIVCYAAGFGELGAGEGRDAEQRLVEAAGDMALIGPNCYGLINYLDRVALWPFAHGGSSPGYGAAIVTQSGMLSSDLTMSQRSLPFAYMVSAGNQAVLSLEDFLDVLVDDDAVRAIGLHIEGLKDVSGFADAASRALAAGKAVVALKTGTSKVGARLTESHTGSLAGSDALYDALFDRLGVVRVTSPAQLIETLKFAVIAGIPRGLRIAGFTCSGGGATMLADMGEKHGLDFAAPTASTRQKLVERLPPIATVSNPLDYTTPIWGDPERLPPVLAALLADGYDAAVIVQDYPLPGIDESKPYYRNDTVSFVQATRAAGIPAAVCSTLPENLDAETRAFLVGEHVAPMQGIVETIEALAGLAHAGRRRQSGADLRLPLPQVRADTRMLRLDEWQAKRLLAPIGIVTPKGCIASLETIEAAATSLGFPLALKLIHKDIAHKTEAGAVTLGLDSPATVKAEAIAMQRRVGRHHPHVAASEHRFLVERMAPRPRAELLVGIRNDPGFGLAMTLASGGVLTELVGDAATLLLPAGRAAIAEAINRLKVSRLLGGYRGQQAIDLAQLLDALVRLGEFAQANASSVGEIEINPLFVLDSGVIAIDALVSVVEGSALAAGDMHEQKQA